MCGPTTTAITATTSPSVEKENQPKIRGSTTTTTDATTSPSAASLGTNNGTGDTSFLGRIFPLNPSVAIVAYAILIPYDAYMNRGFTIWFYWASLFQALTQSSWLSEVLAISGTSICLGWYASIFYEFFYHGLFFEALYKNMPMFLVRHFVREPPNGPCHWDTTAALVAMGFSHFFDLLGHPILTNHHYRKRRQHQVATNKTTGEAFSWSAILGGYLFSRIWSAVHNYYNFGHYAWFYMGFEVYVLNSLDMFYPSYIAETVWYGGLVIWKLTRNNKTDTTSTNTIK